jgi:hypothetical protein
MKHFTPLKIGTAIKHFKPHANDILSVGFNYCSSRRFWQKDAKGNI